MKIITRCVTANKSYSVSNKLPGLLMINYP